MTLPSVMRDGAKTAACAALRARSRFSVHVLTACGAALALLALIAAARGDWPLMFLCSASR